MFVQDQSDSALNRPQLKWLLVVLLALMVGVIVWAVVAFKSRKADDNVMMSGKTTKQEEDRPSEEDIRKQLESLQTTNSNEAQAQASSSKEIQAQLETLQKSDANKNQPQPSEEDIRKQLEALNKR